jgi:hypothetical protein
VNNEERRIWRRNNPEIMKAERRRYYEKHRDEIMLRQRLKRNANPRTRNGEASRYRRRHPDKVAGRQRRYLKKRPEVARAHAAVLMALKTGKLHKPDHCQFCGVPNSDLHGHHANYSKKLDVVWLCSGCHSGIHMRNKARR